MTEHRPTFVVLTGGPGSGKTTVIDHLASEGYAHVPEAGRGIIQAQMAIDGPAVPWRDPSLFAEMMLGWELRSHAAAGGLTGPVLFDRGVPDVIGYLRLEGLRVPDHVLRAARQVRYARRVFIAPPWPRIYRTDAERRQNPDTARRTYEAMVEVYGEFGYQLTELPRASVGERAAFIRDMIGPPG